MMNSVSTNTIPMIETDFAACPVAVVTATPAQFHVGHNRHREEAGF